MARTKTFDPEQAVDTAMQVFWRKGYARTTPQDLLDAIGIGRGSLYNAFDGKQDLFERSLRHYQATQTARMIEILEGPGSPRARVRAALSMVVEAAAADADQRGCLAANTVIELGDDPRVGPLVRAIFDQQRLAFTHAIRVGQSIGEFADDLDPDTTARFLLTTINGMRVLAKAGRDPKELSGLVDMALRAL